MHETRWHSLPHVIGRQQLLAVAGLAAVHLPLQRAVAADRKPRTALTVDEWLAIPVWPTWGGGRVIPMSFDPSLADPFILLAHHKHSFSPGDPLRGPFKAVGGALGLPYVGGEGFAMHPHRGIDSGSPRHKTPTYLMHHSTIPALDVITAPTRFYTSPTPHRPSPSPLQRLPTYRRSRHWSAHNSLA